MYGQIYNNTYWGYSQENGWGGMYYIDAVQWGHFEARRDTSLKQFGHLPKPNLTVASDFLKSSETLFRPRLENLLSRKIQINKATKQNDIGIPTIIVMRVVGGYIKKKIYPNSNKDIE